MACKTVLFIYTSTWISLSLSLSLSLYLYTYIYLSIRTRILFWAAGLEQMDFLRDYTYSY